MSVPRKWREDEQLEIVFWWVGGDSQHPIEDGLDDYLSQDDRSARRRRRPWPGRRANQVTTG